MSSLANLQKNLLLLIVSILLSNRIAGNFSAPLLEHASETNNTITVKYFQMEANGQKLNTTKYGSGHRPSIELRIGTEEKNFTVLLQLNKNLFHGEYTERHYSETGVTYKHLTATDHCYYIGHLINDPLATSAFATCHNISGHFVTNGNVYHVEVNLSDGIDPLSAFITLNSQSDGAKLANYTCGVKTNLPSIGSMAESISMLYPQDLKPITKIVEMYIVADATETHLFGTGTAARLASILNVANSLYQPLNIFLVLIGVETWSGVQRINVSSNAYITLDQWQIYAIQNIFPLYRYDTAFIVTGTNFNNGIVGLANVYGMCNIANSASLIYDLGTADDSGAVMTHEIGHNFGMVHDVSSCVCFDPSASKCIMQASITIGDPSTQFSSCSNATLAASLADGSDLCLYNIPETLFLSGALCGNGVVETGEDCDCGKSPGSECNVNCCNPTTCKLVSGKQCAYGRCCDITTCQITTAKVVCRSSSGPCDLQERCDGISNLCPQDTFFHNGITCTTPDGSSSFCHDSKCRNRVSQCLFLWGVGTEVGPTVCFNGNKQGDIYGNCGTNLLPEQTFKPCANADIQCGQLKCSLPPGTTATTARPVYFNLVHNRLTTSGTFNGATVTCNGLIYTYAPSIEDPGMVPNGSPCGNNQICINQTCQDLSVAQNEVACSNQCPGGVCNNLGRCACLDGSTYPACLSLTTIATTKPSIAPTIGTSSANSPTTFTLKSTLLTSTLKSNLKSTFLTYTLTSTLTSTLLSTLTSTQVGSSANQITAATYCVWFVLYSGLLFIVNPGVFGLELVG